MMEFELAFYQGIIRYIHAGYSWTFKGEDGDPSYQSLWTSGLTDPSLIPQYEENFKRMLLLYVQMGSLHL